MRRALTRFALRSTAALALWFLARRHWPPEWTQPDEATRDRIVQIATLVLGAWAAASLLSAVAGARRWLQARRWERMLDRPDEAHLVPPLASHLLRRRERERGRSGNVLLAVAGIGLIAYGVLALRGDVPEPRDDSGADRSAMIVGIGGGALLLAVGGTLRRRSRSIACEVERLSNDPGLGRPRTAVVAPWRPAATIPILDLRFTGDPAIGFRTTLPRAAARPDEPLHILFLRLFDNVEGTRRFVQGSWRRFGYVHVLRSADQVDADELAAARNTDTIGSLFIASPEQLDAALERQATGRWNEPRPHGVIAQLRWARHSERGKYPVRALLCHGTFWREAVDLLLERMDLVVIDLTGYRPANSGTRFEIQRVIDRYPIARVTLLAGPTSDHRFLEAQIRSMWALMAAGSPNEGGGSRSLSVLLGGGRLTGTHRTSSGDVTPSARGAKSGWR